ncbi:MAG: ATP-binding protein [Lachnospiraceae bacterium]|nr:ATP-binding protein [Lachnospiraceae bacterium]
MIRVLDMLDLVLAWVYVGVFLCMVHTFLPMRRNWLVRILAFYFIGMIATVIVYSNDMAGLLGAMLGFFLYMIVFHRGQLIEKTTAVLIFYPSVIAVNYLTWNTGRRIFFSVTDAPSGLSLGRTSQQMLIEAFMIAFFNLIRLLFWIAAWRFLRKYLHQITSSLTTKMWMIVDVLMLAPFVAIFTIIYFMPESLMVVYPICAASIVSSFGCIYLSAYICNSVQTAYHAQELEMRQAYYRDRISDEERVRSVYHDLKNHLLVLQAQAGNGQEVQSSIQGLQDQIQEYENYYQTGNEILDIIIRDKARAAQERQIDFAAAISFADGAFIEPLDISAIFGNALDNAIEASEKLSEEERIITVKANRVRELLVIMVENNALLEADSQKNIFGERMEKNILMKNRTTKEDAFAHGFGLSNIRNAVQKYDGQCSVKAGEGKFTLKMVIPIPT